MEITENFITAAGKKLNNDFHSFGPSMRDVYILHYVLDGAGFLEFGNSRIKVEKGHFFIIRPFIVYKYYSDISNPWTYVWVNFRGDTFENMVNSIDFESINCQSNCLDNDEITLLFLKIADNFDFRTKSYYCEGLLYSILGLLVDKFPNTQPTISKERFSAACKLIDSNFRDPDFGINTICDQLNISGPTLFRAFKNFSGLSPKSYLKYYRIEKAKKCLDEGMSVKNAAISSGYNDPLYFSRAFTRAVGFNPNKYKKRSMRGDTNMETRVYR